MIYPFQQIQFSIEQNWDNYQRPIDASAQNINY